MWMPGPDILRLLTAIVACIDLSVVDSSAQSYPVRPIRMVVGFSAGGISDVLARMVAQKLSEILGQPVVVENRPGASTAIANERVAASPPDGHTLLMIGTTATVLPSLHAKLPYDLERDLAPVSLLAIAPFVLLVHPSVPAHNVKQLIALARSQPGKLSYGSVGTGSPPNLMAELFNMMAEVRTVHVPYKGGADAAVALASGQIDIYFSSAVSLLPLLETGKLRSLGVTSVTRLPVLPSVPTLDESGLPGYDSTNWNGLCAPAAVPKAIIARLNAAISTVVDAPDMKQSLNKQGMIPQALTPEQFGAFIHTEIEKNAKLIKLIKAKNE